MEHRATQALGELGVKIRSPVTPVGQLSGGQRQGIAICRSVLTDPAVVLLDEPTAALGVAQKEQVLDLLDRLRGQGRAVMVISHDLHDVQQIADTVVVLRLGRKVAELQRGEFDSSDIVDAITGASASRTGGNVMTVTAPNRPAAAKPAREGMLALMSGRLRLIPVLISLVLVWLVFWSQQPLFLSARNLSNLTLQTVVTATLALGLVLILLVAEIDLSVAALSGAAAAIAGRLAVNEGWNPWLACALALAFGVIWGLLQAVLVLYGGPSFIVTLAGSLVLQGLLLWLLPSAGQISLANSDLKFIVGAYLTPAAGWILGVLGLVGYAANCYAQYRGRRRVGLGADPVRHLLLPIGVTAVAITAVVWVLNSYRGIPIVVGATGGAARVPVLHRQPDPVRDPAVRGRRQPGSRAPGRHPGAPDAGLVVRTVGAVRRAGRTVRGFATAGRVQPVRRRQPAARGDRGRGDRRYQPVRRARGRLVGIARSAGHRQHLQRHGSARPADRGEAGRPGHHPGRRHPDRRGDQPRLAEVATRMTGAQPWTIATEAGPPVRVVVTVDPTGTAADRDALLSGGIVDLVAALVAAATGSTPVAVDLRCADGASPRATDAYVAAVRGLVQSFVLERTAPAGPVNVVVSAVGRSRTAPRPGVIWVRPTVASPGAPATTFGRRRHDGTGDRSRRWIGSAMAEALEAAGHRVLRHDLRAAPGGGGMDVVGDLNDPQVCLDLAALADAQEVDLVVAAHGIAGAEALATIAPATTERVMGANTVSVFRLYDAVAAGLARRDGTFLAVASQAGLVGEANNGVYCASKFALIGWLRGSTAPGPRMIRGSG